MRGRSMRCASASNTRDITCSRSQWASGSNEMWPLCHCFRSALATATYRRSLPAMPGMVEGEGPLNNSKWKLLLDPTAKLTVRILDTWITHGWMFPGLWQLLNGLTARQLNTTVIVWSSKASHSCSLCNTWRGPQSCYSLCLLCASSHMCSQTSGAMPRATQWIRKGTEVGQVPAESTFGGRSSPGCTAAALTTQSSVSPLQTGLRI